MTFGTTLVFKLKMRTEMRVILQVDSVLLLTSFEEYL